MYKRILAICLLVFAPNCVLADARGELGTELVYIFSQSISELMYTVRSHQSSDAFICYQMGKYMSQVSRISLEKHHIELRRTTSDAQYNSMGHLVNAIREIANSTDQFCKGQSLDRRAVASHVVRLSRASFTALSLFYPQGAAQVRENLSRGPFTSDENRQIFTYVRNTSELGRPAAVPVVGLAAQTAR